MMIQTPFNYKKRKEEHLTVNLVLLLKSGPSWIRPSGCSPKHQSRPWWCLVHQGNVEDNCDQVQLLKMTQHASRTNRRCWCRVNASRWLKFFPSDPAEKGGEVDPMGLHDVLIRVQSPIISIFFIVQTTRKVTHQKKI